VTARLWQAAWDDEGVDDTVLIAALRAGDRDAFALLVERETSSVYRACLRILGRPHVAEDVTQESFVAAFRAIGDGLLVDTSTEPARVAVAAEARDEIRAAVAALDDPYREVVALRFFGDMSLAEVAETTGRPINTVKTHLRRGLERLRPVFSPEVER
jgi:RNA polymerase sigma-70 factor (ECF subfamily)